MYFKDILTNENYFKIWSLSQYELYLSQIVTKDQLLDMKRDICTNMNAYSEYIEFIEEVSLITYGRRKADEITQYFSHKGLANHFKIHF